MCVWWSIRGVVHFEVLKPGQTVNADFYCEQLDRVNQSLIEKCPAIVNRKRVILQHDNAKPHGAKRTLAKINELGWEVFLTHHTRPILRHRISIYSDRYNIF